MVDQVGPSDVPRSDVPLGEQRPLAGPLRLDGPALAYLAAASEALAGSLQAEATLAMVARLAVPVLGDWCIVDVLDERGRPRRVAGAHADPSREPLVQELRRHPPNMDSGYGVGAALRSGQPVLLAHVDDTMLAAIASDAEHLRLLRALDERSAIVVPLIARGRTLGTILLVGTSARPPYTSEDMPLVMDLARRAALAIDNAHLYEAQRAARLQAEAAEARYRALLEGTADGVLVLDAEGHVLDANEAFTRLVGYSLAELRAQPAVALLGRDPTSVGGGLPCLLDEGAWTGEIVLTCRDRSQTDVEARVATVRLPTGPVTVAAMRDISERRAIERLEHELITMVSHELKNPVTAIRGYADLLLRSGAYNERAIGTIVRQTRRLERLIDDLIDASRLAAGRLQLRFGVVDLNGLAAEVVEQTRALALRHHLTAEIGSAPLLVWADRDRLEQVLQNLLSNAVKYTPPGGSIAVAVRAEAEEARVTVSDSGPGIAPDVLPRLFERFARAANADRAAAGLGLGLYISRMLVEAHGGQITASSHGPGAVVAFSVPRYQPAGARLRPIDSVAGA